MKCLIHLIASELGSVPGMSVREVHTEISRESEAVQFFVDCSIILGELFGNARVCVGLSKYPYTPKHSNKSF